MREECRPPPAPPHPRPRQRAKHTIQDFVLSYLPYHNLAIPDFLKWWDVLVWVEGTIYAMDEDNEDLTSRMLEGRPAAEKAAVTAAVEYAPPPAGAW